jgi:hypothetical protein
MMHTSNNTGDLLKCMSAASFWAPIWLPRESTWLEHAPFGFWLMDALRPVSIVELGANSSYSLAVFCQAVQSLRFNCRCYGVDHWDHKAPAEESSGDDIFRAFSSHLETHYKSFCSLICLNVDQASAHFAADSIDLLHISGCHAYKDGLAAFMSWRSRLSRSAVVLLHNTNVREQGFGVWRLWEELARDHKHFEFFHGCGLGVLGIGDSVPLPLEYLFEATQQPQIATQIRLAYSQLGSMVSSRMQHVNTLGESLQPGIEQARIRARLAEMELELARQSAMHAYFAAQIATKDQLIQDLQKERESIQTEAKQFQKNLDTTAVEISQLKMDQESMAAEVDRLQTERQHLLSSKSWRMTAPLRATVSMLRHKKSIRQNKQ